MIRTIGQTRAHCAMTMMAACHNLRRHTCFRKAGVKVY